MPIRTLYDGTANRTAKPEIDIIAIHGLNPFDNKEHAYDTWRKPRGESGSLWLRDVLPGTLPHMRTMLYIWESSPVINPTRDRFVQEAVQLLENIAADRFDCRERPLILLGHSLGGILIKQALVLAKASTDPRHQKTLKATSALVFLATPHAGPSPTAKVEFGRRCARIAKNMLGNESNDLMEALENNSMFRDILEESWKHQLEDRQFVTCYGTKDTIVPRESAVLGLAGARESVLGLNADHSDICRFDLKKESDFDNYKLLKVALWDVSEAIMKEEHTRQKVILDSFKKEVSDSLSQFGNNPRYGTIEREHDDTLGWIWKTKNDHGPGLVEWFQGGNEMLWISGKPGAGKSTLMKFVHDHDETMKLLRPSQQNSNVLVSFFFHELGEPCERTYLCFLHAIASQLLQHIPELFSSINLRFQRLSSRSKGLSRDKSIWTETELEGALLDMVKNQSIQRTILCMIDGLDECEPKSVPQMMRLLPRLSAGADFGNNRKTHFKILCSSRPDNHIEPAFIKCPKFRIQDFTSADIESFVKTSLTETVDNLYPDDKLVTVSKELIQKIVERAEGVFIWAKLVLNELIIAIENENIALLDEKLEELPSDLTKLYTNILEKIPVHRRHDTFNYLAFIRHDFVYDKTSSILNFQNLMLMTLVILPPSEQAQALSSIKIASEDMIHTCQKTKRVLQTTCRGFLDLPIYNPAGDKAAILKGFCFAPLSVHKTVIDFLFTEPRVGDRTYKFPRTTLCSLNVEKLRSVPDQLTSYFFQLLKLDPPTLVLLHFHGLIYPDSDSDSNHEPNHIIIRVFHTILWFIAGIELLGKENTSSAVIWLPRIESYLKFRFPRTKDLGDIYAKAYFNKCRFLSKTILWKPDFLDLAVMYNLVSYVESILKSKPISLNNRERPLLQCAIDGFPYHMVQIFEIDLRMVQLLLDHNCSPEWEYLWQARGRTRKDRRTFMPTYVLRRFSALYLLFLEYKVNPNEQINFKDYSGSALHIMASLDGGPLYDDEEERLIPGLLRAGADVTSKDSNGDSVIELAKKFRPEILYFLDQ